VEHVAEDWSDVLKLPGTDDKPGSSVQDHVDWADGIARRVSSFIDVYVCMMTCTKEDRK